MPRPLLIAGRYRLGEVRGEGTTAVLYEAVDEREGGVVAVKLLASALFRHEAMRQRFEREARIMAGLDHPAIVRVLDWGVDGEHGFIVQELVEGGSLRDHLDREGPVDPRVATAVLQRVALALHHAHVAGIAHRDVNPGNILFTPEGRPKLTDFGIARPLDATAAELTGARAVLGTPRYMAPEQLVDSRQVDNRVDIYGLGATLYAAVRGEDPPRLFDVEPPGADLSPWEDVPEPVAHVILQATRFQPEERYATAAELARALAVARVELPEGPGDETLLFVRDAHESQVFRRQRSFAGLAAVRDEVGRPSRRRGPINLAEAVPRGAAPGAPRRVEAPEPAGPPADGASPLEAPTLRIDPVATGEAAATGEGRARRGRWKLALGLLVLAAALGLAWGLGWWPR